MHAKSEPLSIVLVDDEPIYRDELASLLEKDGHDIKAANSSKAGDYSGTYRVDRTRFPEGADLVILDNRFDGDSSYWRDLLVHMRTLHPHALILLVSQYSDHELKVDVSNVMQSDAKTGMLFKGDPLLTYLPKPQRPAPVEPNGLERYKREISMHFGHIREIAQVLSEQKAAKKDLQDKMFKAALDAARQVRGTRSSELIKSVNEHEKDDTKYMDVIAERCIKNTFAPVMHYYDVVICTEEAGLHNDLFHRIGAPRFFVFSDPFDGSSAFVSLVNEHKGIEDKTLGELVEDEAVRRYWTITHGNMTLNSPIISVVLAERHRLVFAVLVNLFTRDVFVSTEGGNYWRGNVDLDNGQKQPKLDVGDGTWSRFCERSLPEERDLFLCTLAKRNTSPAKLTSHFRHAYECIGPLLHVAGCSWGDSLELRYEQGNFTPGPGRILFLSDVSGANEYYKETMPGREYASILSAGEPLTEWIGWLAFLRHMKGLSVYCLRRKDMPSGRCPHQRTPGDICTLQPDEPLSIFRRGFIDLGVLQTAYGSRVRSYCDTILVVHDDDKEWDRVLKGPDGDFFERVWPLNASVESSDKGGAV